jgi:hypothetical protein
VGKYCAQHANRAAEQYPASAPPTASPNQSAVQEYQQKQASAEPALKPLGSHGGQCIAKTLDGDRRFPILSKE